jgi:aminoglycoside phosphotransferase (APT) family kinase protein
VGIYPAAELDVAEPLVRALLAEQHPDLAGLPLRELDAGWDNVLWRLGDDSLVRLPRRQVSAQLTLHEQRWLPLLAGSLPLPVPSPVRVGVPSRGYPWPWSVVPWLDGRPGDRAGITRPDDAAARLGGFFRALHREAPADAPRNPFRGVPLAERTDVFEDRLHGLAMEVDVGATRAVWDRAVAATPWSGPPVWLHGDPHPANMLVVDGTVGAVIDFGDMCAGDAATDLAAAWMLLPPVAVPAFFTAYGAIDADSEQRALGWAVLFGLMLLAIGLDRAPGSGHPTYEPIGRATLARALAHAANARSGRPD